ncbi:MAG: CDP-diacylglycerol--serine O-phosphatidyltransferase [Desulfobacteraceae bacterium]|nr:CDP-diacylglycerol--serine O-phosphatidyltransferase [Desulfobacteraceae bacterium]MBC2756937.1 CDP-diacylglycerol--serine O-phosphatidyltransferase [Desulfobacteraceae bacterium]
MKKGIYILPNFFTLMNLFFGFYSVICSIEGNFRIAAISILIAAVFDLLDGKIARATNTSSRFGAEFDSLADLVSFGMAPGLMLYLWILQPLGRLGWLAAFLFMACGALRLARFNTNLDQPGDGYFSGLPIPAAAGMVAVTVLFVLDLGLNPEIIRYPILFLTYMLSFLMVSTIKYYSFKKVDLFKSMNFNVLVSMMLILILIASKPSITLYVVALGYIASGPVKYFLWHSRKNDQQEDLISAGKIKD